ncbi:MAG: lipopolysaccharide transport periplasmic protein LptA [Gammaproteobacteria bacterium HGW-Gammaproteobacteria-14]|nr:MAG: lipopolysaccharide transport periplasmic protein LptA [Gammaproteobacteria bacterium HGW-Gammaproteobacteria-14]
MSRMLAKPLNAPGLMLIALAGLGWVTTSNGAENPIVVRAESATMNQVEGTGLYEGNVEMNQGERLVKADRILITLRDKKPYRIEANGKPVIMEDVDDISARAESLLYDVASQRIYLSGNALVRHQGRIFEGAELEYELDSKRIIARGGSDDGRIRMVIPADDGANP